MSREWIFASVQQASSSFASEKKNNVLQLNTKSQQYTIQLVSPVINLAKHREVSDCSIMIKKYGCYLDHTASQIGIISLGFTFKDAAIMN